MSTISPAIVARIQSFCGEMNDLSVLITHVQESVTNDLLYNSLQVVGDQLDHSIRCLAAAPRLGEEAGGYALPLNLELVATFAGQAAPLILVLADSFDENSRLALDYAGATLEKHGKTARYIAQTVAEELPPLVRETIPLTA